VITWEKQRKQIETSMSRGNHTKYPHIFKASDIVLKQKRERTNMLNEIESLQSARRKGSYLGSSMNGFDVDEMRKTHRMNVKNSMICNSVDLNMTQYD
jgi:hypothetical protein